MFQLKILKIGLNLRSHPTLNLTLIFQRINCFCWEIILCNKTKTQLFFNQFLNKKGERNKIILNVKFMKHFKLFLKSRTLHGSLTTKTIKKSKKNKSKQQEQTLLSLHNNGDISNSKRKVTSAHVVTIVVSRKQWALQRNKRNTKSIFFLTLFLLCVRCYFWGC